MRRQHPLLGVGAIALAAMCFATMDSITRHTGRFVPVLLLLWSRYAVQALFMLAWLGLGKVTAMRSPQGLAAAGFGTAHPRFQLLRGLLLLGCSAASFYGLQFMPVAEFTAIVMLTPILVTLLGAWLLHERVSWVRWTLVVGGFVGAVIVTNPGASPFGWAVLFPLAGAISYAFFQVLTSRLSSLESPYTTHFYTGLVGAVLLTPLLALSPIPVLQAVAQTPADLLALIAVVGLCGTVGHLLLILALGMAPTSTLMPVLYLQIPTAAVIGWWFLGHAPDAWGWTGMAIVMVCGAASAWLNLRSAPKPPAVVSLDTVAD